MKICLSMMLTVFTLTPTFASHSIEESLSLLRSRHQEANEIIVKVKDNFSYEEAVFLVKHLQKILISRDLDLRIRPLFLRGADRYRQERLEFAARSNEELAHLENYFHLKLSRSLSYTEAEHLLKKIFETTGVDFAYIEPKTELAVIDENRSSVQNETNADTPNYEDKQFHLKVAPDGVDAEYAWQFPGGAGKGIKLIDSEWGWNQTHEDYLTAFWKSSNANQYSDHGTAVWGEVAAKRDGVGVTGIAHDSQFGTVYFQDAGSYDIAASQLSVGDVLIIEQHKQGPDNGNWTAVEYWQATFDAFKAITSRGIHIVEAAGNGGSNFDASVYNKKFDLKTRDSGAIIVGAAGAPNSKTPHERLGFSNYGARVDVHGYGNNVVTTGYGTLFNGSKNRMYTNSFSGTSSATPIVAGSVASVLGMLKALGRSTTPSELREALRKTGTPQQGDLSKRIGNLPDLKQLRKYYGMDN